MPFMVFLISYLSSWDHMFNKWWYYNQTRATTCDLSESGLNYVIVAADKKVVLTESAPALWLFFFLFVHKGIDGVVIFVFPCAFLRCFCPCCWLVLCCVRIKVLSVVLYYINFNIDHVSKSICCGRFELVLPDMCPQSYSGFSEQS